MKTFKEFRESTKVKEGLIGGIASVGKAAVGAVKTVSNVAKTTNAIARPHTGVVGSKLWHLNLPT